MTRLAATVRSERRLLRDARDCFVRAPASTWTFRTLGSACRVSGEELQRRYRSVPLLYRRAVLADFTDAGSALREGPPMGAGLSSTAAAARAAHAAGVFGSPTYQSIAYLLVRDGAALPWLAAEHGACVLRPAAYDIARGFGGRLRPGEIPLALEAVETALERLQRAMMLPRLVPLPGQSEPDDHEAIGEAAAALLKAAATARAASQWGLSGNAAKYR